MKVYIALFRGINVGGAGTLPMKELKRILEEKLELRNVRTYIQSGNAVFEGPKTEAGTLAKKIADAVAEERGFRPEVMVLEPEELRGAMEANPFPEGEPDSKSLHLTFLASAPKKPDMESLEGLKKENERYALIGNVFYLHAPDGIGRSKLAARIEKAMGVPGTARNWRSVCKIAEMAEESES